MDHKHTDDNAPRVTPRGGDIDEDDKSEMKDDTGADHSNPLPSLNQLAMVPSVAALPPALYFTEDPLEHLEIRVTLKRVTRAPNVKREPKTYRGYALQRKAEATRRHLDAGSSAGSSTAGTTHGARAHHSAQDIRLRKVFSWQEKEFSVREVLRTQHHSFRPRTPLDRQYVTQVRDMLKKMFPQQDKTEMSSRSYAIAQRGMQLSSKVDDDLFIDPDLYKLDVVNSDSSPSKHLNPLAKRVVTLPLRQREKSHLARDNQFRTFTVMATVDIPGDTGKLESYRKINAVGEEHVLLQIREYTDGTFDVKPDFNSADEDSTDPKDPGWYYFVSEAGVPYAFRVENLSESSGNRAFISARERDIREKLQAREADLVRNRLTSEFEDAPPSTHMRLNMFGQVTRAFGFEEDNIYFEYELVLPDAGWVWSPRDKHQRVSSISHMSHAFLAGPNLSNYIAEDTRVHHFCFPIEFELYGQAGNPVKYPALYFQVSSVDMWDRHRVVGYGFAQLPQQPGTHNIKVSTWRPVGSVRSEYIRYYIGGAPSLQDKKLAGLPADVLDPASAVKQVKFLNRYGFRTRTSGTLEMSLNIIHTHGVPSEVKTSASSRHIDVFSAARTALYKAQATKSKSGTLQAANKKKTRLQQKMSRAFNKAVDLASKK